jgi:hypothetical protein
LKDLKDTDDKAGALVDKLLAVCKRVQRRLQWLRQVIRTNAEWQCSICRATMKRLSIQQLLQWHHTL